MMFITKTHRWFTTVQCYLVYYTKIIREKVIHDSVLDRSLYNPFLFNFQLFRVSSCKLDHVFPSSLLTLQSRDNMHIFGHTISFLDRKSLKQNFLIKNFIKVNTFNSWTYYYYYLIKVINCVSHLLLSLKWHVFPLRKKAFFKKKWRRLFRSLG